MNLILTVLILTALIDLVLGILVLAHSYRRRYAWYFIGIIVGTVAWLAGDALLLFSHSPAVVGYARPLFYLAPMLIPLFIFYFADTFPDEAAIPVRTAVLAAAYVAVSFALVCHYINSISSSALRYPANAVSPVFPGFILYGLYIASFFSVAFVRLYQKMGQMKGVARSQVAYTFYGLFLSGILAMVTNLIFPAAGVWQLIWLGPSFTLVGVAAVTLAIIRYRLFDIRFYVISAIAYLSTAFITTFILITPFILFLNRLFRAHLTPNQLVLGIILSVLFLHLVLLVRNKINAFTGGLFLRGYYDMQDVLSQLDTIILRTGDLTELRTSTLAVLRQALRPTLIRYALFDDEDKKDRQVAALLDAYTKKYGVNVVDVDKVEEAESSFRHDLQAAGIRLAVKLRTTHEDLGFVVLGEKRSGEFYTERDKHLLTIVADEVAISLQDALRFEQIQRFNTTLQEEVNNATSKLRRTNQKLQELDETKDDFISMASHQLRTPLTSVKGYLNMVLDGDAGKVTPMQAKMLEQAFISSQRMAYLITDLLNISRLKTGKFVIEPRPTDLAEVVQQEVMQLQGAAKTKGVELAFTKQDTTPELMLDEVKTRQVIMNFIDNAIYYTPNGGHIKVELLDKTASVELRVTDDGIGVPRGEQHHLFSKFYRATNARLERPDGTGIGLFMAKKVVVAQGGSVIFSSREGHGSTFGFMLPKAHLTVSPNQASRSPRQHVAA